MGPDEIDETPLLIKWHGNEFRRVSGIVLQLCDCVATDQRHIDTLGQPESQERLYPSKPRNVTYSTAAVKIHCHEPHLTRLRKWNHRIKKRPVVRFRGINRHHDDIEFKHCKAVLNYLRIGVAGNTEESSLPGVLGGDQRLHGSAGAEDLAYIVLCTNVVYLPEVDVVRSQSGQRLLEVDHRLDPVTSVGLGGEEHLAPSRSERRSEIGFAIAVYSSGVEVGESEVESSKDQGLSFPEPAGGSEEAMPAESEHRYLSICPAELPHRE